MKTCWLVCAVIVMSGCGVGVEGEAGELQAPNASEEVASVDAELGCMSMQILGEGWCGQQNWRVTNRCWKGMTVRIDIADWPDTSCKYLPVGVSATFTSSCHWAAGPPVARGVVSCG